MNNNGYIDTGDIQNSDDNAPIVSVDGTNPATAGDIIVSFSQNVTARNGTIHILSGSNEVYGLQLIVNAAVRQPVNVSITAGTQMSGSRANRLLMEQPGDLCNEFRSVKACG